MSRVVSIVIWVLAAICVLLVFGVMLPSLVSCLMVILLMFAVADFLVRRRRNTIRTFNSAVRAVCQHEGAITKVAIAFSRSGALSGPCYEYARRLMKGEDPVEAAGRSHVPLQLQTAVALRTPPREKSAGEYGEVVSSEVSKMGMDTMPAYGQIIYLTVTALVTCFVLTFMRVFILPTFDAMFEEFFGDRMPNRWLFSLTPAIIVLALITLVVVVLIPVLNRGHFFGVTLPRWIPSMPQHAERNAETLHGLADAIEAGWSYGKALSVAHSIAIKPRDRISLEHAMRGIQRGLEPVYAFHETGWIDRSEAAWLVGASADRTVGLLRNIADQKVRDARANLRWFNAIFFPFLVLLMGAAVLAFAYGVFGALMRISGGLA